MLYEVLDKGFIRLVDSMGDDTSVVQAARVSLGQGSKGEERDQKLINFLMRNNHGTPFEMVSFKFHVKCPIFVMRQWIRHRMGSFNEISGRYVEFEDEFYIPEQWRSQASKNKQGSAGETEPLISWEPIGLSDASPQLNRICNQLYEVYNELLNQGVAREQARMILPVNLYTQFYWQVNARSLMNFLSLRMAPDAQWEIRQYAYRVWDVFRNKMPWTAAAWEVVDD
jgi:thymidylate synthase (FAD)